MSNSKEKRKTFLRLKDGQNFQSELYKEAWDNGKDMHPDDFLIALDEMRRIAGIPTE